MIVSFPHALEDFHYGDLTRIGVPVPVEIALLVIAYALQLTGIALTARAARFGPVLLGIMGAVWSVGAIVIHGRDLVFAGPDYRSGLISKLLEVLIIILGGAIVIVAAGMIRPPRASQRSR